MPGTHITDRQVRRYMEHRRQGNTQFVAAAKAGFGERSARRIEAAAVLPSQREQKPRGRTRPDALADVWLSEAGHFLRIHLLQRQVGRCAACKTVFDPDLAQGGNTNFLVRRDPATGDTTRVLVHRWCRPGRPPRSTSHALADA